MSEYANLAATSIARCYTRTASLRCALQQACWTVQHLSNAADSEKITEGEGYLASHVMCIEVEAADMLVDAGEGAELLNGGFSLLQDHISQALVLPWNILHS